MHQGREIAIVRGFVREKEPHLVWSLKTSMADLDIKIKKLLKKRDPFSKREAELIIVEYKTIERILNGIDYRLHHLPRQGWYCARCGDLEPGEVTNDERCSICGGTLPL